MRILITGGAGYIGSNLVVAAEKAGHEVYIFDNFSNSDRSTAFKLSDLCDRKPWIRFLGGDIENTSLLTHYMKLKKIELVIHLAAKKYADESAAFPLEYYRVNVAGTVSLLEAMKMAKVNKLIFSSSAAVYGNQWFTPITENALCAPLSPYGQSKHMAERIIRESGINAVCLRFFNPVGSLSGLSMPKDRSLVSSILSVIKGEQDHLRIFGDGSAVRDFIHIQDLIDAHLLFLEFNGFEIFNVGRGVGQTVSSVVEIFREISGHEIPVIFEDKRRGDTLESIADVQKIWRYLGWKSKRDLREMAISAISAETSDLSSERP